jgi:hypothetical protein
MDKLIEQSIQLPIEMCNLIYQYAQDTIRRNYIEGKSSCVINNCTYTLDRGNIYQDKKIIYSHNNIAVKNKYKQYKQYTCNNFNACILYNTLYFTYTTACHELNKRYAVEFACVYFVNYYTLKKYKVLIHSHYTMFIINNKILCQYRSIIYKYTITRDFTIIQDDMIPYHNIVFLATYKNMLVCVNDDNVLLYDENIKLQRTILIKRKLPHSLKTSCIIYENENNKLVVHLFNEPAVIIDY